MTSLITLRARFGRLGAVQLLLVVYAADRDHSSSPTCDVGCVCVQEPAWTSPPGAAFVAAIADTWTATESHGHISVLAKRSGMCREQVR